MRRLICIIVSAGSVKKLESEDIFQSIDRSVEASIFAELLLVLEKVRFRNLGPGDCQDTYPASFASTVNIYRT